MSQEEKEGNTCRKCVQAGLAWLPSSQVTAPHGFKQMFRTPNISKCVSQPNLTPDPRPGWGGRDARSAHLSGLLLLRARGLVVLLTWYREQYLRSTPQPRGKAAFRFIYIPHAANEYSRITTLLPAGAICVSDHRKGAPPSTGAQEQPRAGLPSSWL